MKSKVINMAEHSRDREDLALEALFASEPIADDGFSASVVRKLRRRLWVRRLALPAAVGVGAAIAAKPLLGLIQAAGSIASVLPAVGADNVLLQQLPNLSVSSIVLAVTLVGLLMLPILDD